MINQKINEFTVISEGKLSETTSGYKYRMMSCLCSCGNIFEARKSKIKANKVVSCGCTRRYKERLISSHVMYGTRPYQIWFAMKQRCDTKENETHGKRGITYCEQWKDFSNFWSDMSCGYSDDLSLDRIDNNLGYYPENCRWTSKSVQAYNKRKSLKNNSGKTGVHRDTKSNCWVVKFSLNGFNITRNFKFLVDAIFYRMELEQQHYGKVKE